MNFFSLAAATAQEVKQADNAANIIACLILLGGVALIVLIVAYKQQVRFRSIVPLSPKPKRHSYTTVSSLFKDASADAPHESERTRTELAKLIDDWKKLREEDPD